MILSHDMEKSKPIFEAMGLPFPNLKDFFHGNHLLLFVDAFGVSIRIGERHTLPYHDRILEPLKTVTLGKDLVFEILPIIRQYPLGGENWEPVVERGRASYFLRREFAREGLDFADPYNRNLGFVPYVDRGVKREILVVLDRGEDCVMPVKLRKNRADFTESMNDFNDEMDRLQAIFLRSKNQPPPPSHFSQIKAYQDLREIIACTWPDGDDLPSPAFAAEFWPACERAVKDGRLLRICDQATSSDFTPDSFDVRVAANNYAETMIRRMNLT